MRRHPRRFPHRMLDLESALKRLACLCTLAGLAACGGGSPLAAASPTVDTDGGGTGATLGATRQGEGTYYAATGAGACSYDASADRMVAAMNHTDYAGSAACGEHVRVTGPLGTVTVRIVDECPECAPGDVDLSAEAFARIAEPVAGRVPITWQVVTGAVSGPVQYRYKEGSTRYWTAIQVRNHPVPIARLEIQPDGTGNWIAVPRTDYNYFVHPVAIGAGALQVRVTSSTGVALIDRLPQPQGGLVVDGTGQFQ
ncbi:Rare lipoprotein A [Leptothrix cholodnii SP-6]|uniref:Rare lipoprotein A n=1 Tax=Leptothrix cholodnii (strain ATCC 51168 / LMG 8142 / SP-6) TaxID=395495 RepID=B1Y0F2_LEPCP|nr:expansin EXLX1 family cellulose-binding protein [Leptothrix cholodnii]ACB36631.1 Rare lipoprotein A [Leptothrix cholodnii SP-6]